jgi:glycosyltransferase involved in cell wall biosynthesis
LPCAGRHYGAITGTATTFGAFVGRRLESRESTAFVSVSQATATGNRVDARSNHAVVPNFLAEVPTPEDIDDWLTQLPREQFFLYVGDLRRVKGYDVLLAAYAAAHATRPLVVIGKRWPDSPDTLPANVHVFENWPNHAVRAAYARARAAIVPSVWAEPFGIVAIEAMSAGIPVVASATGGLRDIVDDQRTGVLVTPGCKVELATAIRTMDTDDALVERLGRAAAREAERYSADAVVPQIEAVYASVLERPKAGVA